MSSSRLIQRLLSRSFRRTRPIASVPSSSLPCGASELLPGSRQQQQQWRSMVVVTTTNASDPPSIHSSDDSDNAAAVNTSFDAIVNEDERLTITPSCVRQVHALLKRRNKSADEMFLRVFVDAGGCSGFTYQFELDDELVDDEDIIFEPQGANGARVVVDEASLNIIHGSKIDYVQEMIKSAFVVADNPQSESACGCGSSFAVKNFASNPALD